MTGESKTTTTSEGYTIAFNEHESVEINLNISKETMAILEVIAGKKDLSVISIIKFFISKGIRDLEPELAKNSVIKRFKNRKNIKENLEVDLAA